MWDTLSNHAFPARRDLAWLALKKIPALTPDAMFRTPAKTLTDVVGLVALRRDETVERLRELVHEFRRRRDVLDGEALARVPLLTARRRLVGLAAIDAGMSARALLYCAGFVVLPVDEDVSRVVCRLMGAAAPRGAVRADHARHARRMARRWLSERLPRDVHSYQEAILYLRHHAQHTCLTVGPHCTVCPLAGGCPSRMLDGGPRVEQVSNGSR